MMFFTFVIVLALALLISTSAFQLQSSLRMHATTPIFAARAGTALRMSAAAPQKQSGTQLAASTASSPNTGFLSKITSALPPPKTLKKLLPLGTMFFFILFNYTILRDTKDVLVVTSGGAEVIPFLKTYVQLPAAILFTIFYSSLSNKLPQDKVCLTISPAMCEISC